MVDSKHGISSRKKTPFMIKNADPRNIPTAADHNEEITLTVPTDIPCNFQGVSALFRRIDDDSFDMTASGNVDDYKDGTMLLSAVFDATRRGCLQIILVKNDCILWTTEDSHLVVGE